MRSEGELTEPEIDLRDCAIMSPILFKKTGSRVWRKNRRRSGVLRSF